MDYLIEQKFALMPLETLYTISQTMQAEQNPDSKRGLFAINSTN